MKISEVWREMQTCSFFCQLTFPLIAVLNVVMSTSHSLEQTFYSNFPECTSLCHMLPRAFQTPVLGHLWEPPSTCENLALWGATLGQPGIEDGGCLPHCVLWVDICEMHSSRLSDGPRRIRPQLPTDNNLCMYWLPLFPFLPPQPPTPVPWDHFPK